MCGRPWNPDINQQALLAEELGCASLGPASGACNFQPTSSYPLQSRVRMMPIPAQDSMDNPCAGVPANSWCPNR